MLNKFETTLNNPGRIIICPFRILVCIRRTWLGSFLLIAVLSAGCSGGKEPEERKILLSDYDSYPEYWFDKTARDHGITTAEVAVTEYDFGVLPPDVAGRKRFKIKNKGANPLLLIPGPKSCKCTGIKLIDRIIQPNETGEIELRWATVEHAKAFSHSGSIYTNDPEKRLVKFKIKGKVAREFAAVPGTFHFERVLPDSKKESRELLVFSEEWESFSLEDLKCSLLGKVKLETFPMSAEQRKDFKAKSGQNIRLTLEPAMPPGRFTGLVHFKVKGPEEIYERQIEISGKVVKRISLKAVDRDILDETGLITLNRVIRTEGLKQTFYLTVNDEEKELPIKHVAADPDFIHVGMAPLNKNVSSHGTYLFDITIPPNQQEAVYNRPDSFGNLKVEFDHPRVQPLILKLNFYIVD